MITRNYSIFYLFSFFLSSLTYGEESKEAPSYDRKDLVGHYVGSNDDLTVSIELDHFIYKFFNFEDFVTIESFDKGEMGHWEINDSTIEFDDPKHVLNIREDGTLLYGESGIVLKPVGPNFLGVLFHFNASVKNDQHAAHYVSDGLLSIQKDFSEGVEQTFTDDALHLHNLGYMYQTGTKYNGGRSEGMTGMTDQILDDEIREGLIDFEKAYDYYSKAAEKGYVPSIFNLAVYHEEGTHVETDIIKAVELYRKAADMGHTLSEKALGNYLYSGAEGVPTNEEEGKRYWRLAAAKGNRDAQFNLAHSMLIDPESSDEQWNEACNLIWRSALRDHPRAFYSLYSLALQGDEEWDESITYNATAFLLNAANLGDSLAIDHLRKLHQRGEDEENAVTPDFSKEEPVNSAPAVSDSNSITLFANGGSVYVVVTQKNDGARIYRGAIEVDNPLTIDKSGPVEIMFTRGERLVIETGDERFRPSASGPAKITIE